MIQVTIPLQRGPLESVAGKWTTTEVDGDPVTTHDGTKWTAKEGYPLALFRRPQSFTGGTLRVEFLLVAGSDDHTAGLVFGHRGRSYYYVRYNTKDGNVALWRMDGPKRTVIKHGEEHEQLPRSEWHQLDVSIDGRMVRGSVRGTRLVVEHELDQPVAGRIGFWTKPDATTAFRNLEVSESLR